MTDRQTDRITTPKTELAQLHRAVKNPIHSSCRGWIGACNEDAVTKPETQDNANIAAIPHQELHSCILYESLPWIIESNLATAVVCKLLQRLLCIAEEAEILHLLSDPL